MKVLVPMEIRIVERGAYTALGARFIATAYVDRPSDRNWAHDCAGGETREEALALLCERLGVKVEEVTE